jgi:hypothetical protein
MALVTVLSGMQKQLNLLFSLLMLASPLACKAEADGFQQMSFTVDGVVRTALVYVNEFTFRFNRKANTMQSVFSDVLNSVTDSPRLPYKTLIQKPA